MAANLKKRLQRLEQLWAEITEPNSQAKCNCRQFTMAASREYFAAEMNQTCPVHGFRSLGKISVLEVEIVDTRSGGERHLAPFDDLLKDYESRRARHRQEMLNRIQVEDDSEEF